MAKVVFSFDDKSAKKLKNKKNKPPKKYNVTPAELDRSEGPTMGP